MENQKKVWDKIAPEWNTFRTKPMPKVSAFLQKQKGKIIDLGSGSGRHLTKIPNGKIYLLDFSKEMIRLAKQKSKEKNIPSEFKVSSSTKIPFKKNFFDSAICIALLHCMKKTDAEKTLKELFRVLKPKAKALVSVWNKNSKWFKNREKETQMNWKNKGLRYLYLYEKNELKKLLEKTGFKIIQNPMEQNKANPLKNLFFVVQKPE